MQRGLKPDDIIRSVKQRDRICIYLFNTGAVWMFAGVIVVVVNALFHSQFNPLNASIEWTVMISSMAIYSATYALTLAIYRCPVCDKYLGRFSAEKLHCPNCNVQVRESK